MGNEPTREELAAILQRARTIAVVGLSDKPDRESYVVAAYLQRAGYRIVPVNPAVQQVLGEQAYPDLAAVPADVEIDVVDVFRRPELVPPVMEQAIARGVDVVWLQLGIRNDEAAERGRTAGVTVVQDRCIKIEHSRSRAAG